MCPNLESHSETLDLAANLTSLVNENEPHSVAETPCLAESSNACSPASANGDHDELSPTIISTSESAEYCGRHLSAETSSGRPIITSDAFNGTENCAESSGIDKLFDGHSPTATASRRDSATSKASSSSVKTPDGNVATVSKTSSSNSSRSSGQDSAERISKYLIQYVPETPK